MPGGETRRAQARPCTASRSGAFPADAAEALSIKGRILPSDATAVSGQIPGIPSPALPGRAAAPGKGPGFSQAGVCPGPESPRAGSRAYAVGGLRSWAPRATPELPSGWRPDPTAPTLSDLIWVGGCCSLCVVAAAVPITRPGRAAPVCQFPLPVPSRERGDCQVWSCRGGCSGHQAQLTPSRGLPPPQLGQVGGGLVRPGGGGSGWSPGKTPEQLRKNQAKKPGHG